MIYRRSATAAMRTLLGRLDRSSGAIAVVIPPSDCDDVSIRVGATICHRAVHRGILPSF